MTTRRRLPQIIWMLWLQGWRAAPPVALASRTSWVRRNPDWRVIALDGDSLKRYLPARDIERIIGKEKPPEALSDEIRFELLHRYGGVWADATTICAHSLSGWLPDAMESGFFAFCTPVPDRMLATWFIAAERGSLAILKWRAASIRYWTDRAARDAYFWPHLLFAELYESDRGFRDIWDGTPKHSARHAFHLNPGSPVLFQPPTTAYRKLLETIPEPVLKLTHKLAATPGPDSLFAALCAVAEAGAAPCDSAPIAPKRILIGWYGSFSGHGTIGDLRSLETIAARLVASGHEVTHATAADLEIPGAARADWTLTDPAMLDAVLFVCGPILKDHQSSAAFFAHFASAHIAGVGVSLLPAGDANRFDPFATVFARQGGARDYGDVAILAPMPSPRRTMPNRQPVIGLALRGPQAEYGIDRCLWRETEAMVQQLCRAVHQTMPCEVVVIENHLVRAGLTPDEIERRYAGCDLIVTSRFHGATIALRHGIPFIAIDQISGGAKVYDLLIGLGWPYVYTIDGIDDATLLAAAESLLRAPDRVALAAARNKAVADANDTLDQLDRWAASLPRIGRCDASPG